MDGDDRSHRRSRSTPQAIPLQDLNPPLGTVEHDEQQAPTHKRSLSDKGRDILRGRTSIVGRGAFSGRYSPIVERSPSPTRSTLPAPRTIVTAPSVTEQPVQLDYDGEDYSPLADRGGFQDAMGFAGVIFTRESSSQPVDPSAGQRRQQSFSTLAASDYDNGEADIAGNQRVDVEGHYQDSSLETDTTPLTSSIHPQPTHSGVPSTPSGQRHDRSNSSQSVQFISPANASPGRRLGDDLRSAETGLRSRSSSALSPSIYHRRSRSPSSAGSAIVHAGSMMVRKMSQRVVNLSNQPEVVEQNVRRKSSIRQSRLEGPPVFPALAEYAHDVPATNGRRAEKEEGVNIDQHPAEDGSPQANPLKGTSLKLFDSNSKLRIWLCDVLVHPWTEPTILILIILQTILLAIDSTRNVFNNPRSREWGSSWINYALLVLYVIYTVEIAARIIVSGLFVNPIEFSTINRQAGLWKAVSRKVHELFAPHQQTNLNHATSSFGPLQPSIVRSFTTLHGDVTLTGSGQHQQRLRLAHRAFLRHSFNRLDFVAVVSFWISFALATSGVQSGQHVYVFRMLSCLRILRLLGLTSGTSVILRSLKKAAPLLVHVSFLIGFFWLLFAIVGLQSFKSSLRRTCVWVDPEPDLALKQANFTNEFQFCGGYLDSAGKALPWLTADGRNGTAKHKGFLCPPNSLCVEGGNPYNGTVSFDNILQSLELVFVIMTSNTFTDLMYYLTDSDHLAAALFFAAGIIVMALWLVNLLIAVITSSFQVIREESKASAFTAEQMPEAVEEDEERVLLEENEEEEEEREAVPKPRESALQRTYKKVSWLFMGIILYDLICQALRSASMSPTLERFIDSSETVVTLVLLAEILIRFSVDWAHFFRSRRNLFDLFLVVVTTVMLIPKIRSSGEAYAWLSFFQIVRIYRVVLGIPLIRDLIMVVLGNISGLLNLIMFVFLLTFLAAIFAAQLFGGQIPQEDNNGNPIRVTFATIYNSFLGMYQVFSSENWTAILYNVTAYNVTYNTAWIGAAFLIIWFILGYFIVLNMFIAVIQESFDISEDEKRLHQVRAFLHQKELGGSTHGNLSLSTILKFRRVLGRHRDPLDYGQPTMEMLVKDAVVNEFLQEQGEDSRPLPRPVPQNPGSESLLSVEVGPVTSLFEKIAGLVKNQEPNPFYSRLQFSRAYEDFDPRSMAREVILAAERRKKAQREYLVKHPHYNVSLYLFKPDNPIRRLCQRMVGQGRGGRRIEGVDPSMPVWYAFSAFIYAAIVAMVLLACVTTPVYQKQYFQEHDFSVKNWFVFTDMGFAVLFTIEAMIKVIADGFFWTPNAYFRGSWGFIDGIVLITLWINVLTQYYNEGAVSRAVGAFKALRALRLLNVSDSARDTFHSVMVVGGWKVISAAFVSLSLLVPFAIWGVNLFNGKLKSCNDTNSNISNLADCVGEYLSHPYHWDVLSPRQAANPWFDFDDFGSSLLILFTIVSQEGWTDVMWAAESITGVFSQPSPFASQGNAVFFVIFNLLGAVFVVTLFISVFMRNYTEQTGVAFLTTDQRCWLELRKILRQISPSKRPSSNKKRETWRQWCYRRAIHKTGGFQRFITAILILHLLLLCLEWYPSAWWWDRTRDYLFLVFTIIYIINIAVRIVGLTWPRFCKSSWDLFSIFAVSGTCVTTALLLSNFHHHIYGRLHKLFVVSIALLLIPRNNQLDQLFKTAAASLTAIGNLLATWFVLFLVFAIALTQTFGLTQFGAHESNNINFRTVPKALILLFRTSTGEGWNSIMEDFARITPPNCVRGDGDHYFEGSCGSPEWARALFIMWNILSMYIFVNLFISLIYESFSYVYQRSSGLSVISRKEIRNFKQAWSELDPDGTGFISKEDFPRLLRELSGVFDMRIYEGDFTVRKIIEDCNIQRAPSALPVEGQKLPVELDLKMLNERLSHLPVDEVRARRARLNRFHEEVFVSADADQGISFSSLLMIIAHYKVINDNKSLRLEEYLRRKARLQRIDEAVRRKVVIGFFDTVYYMRILRRMKEAKNSARMTAVPQFTVPEIFVEEDTSAVEEQAGDTLKTSPIIAPAVLSPISTGGSLRLSIDDVDPVSPPDGRIRSNSIQITPTSSPTRAHRPSLSAYRPSDSNLSDISGNWHLATALAPVSRPSSPGDGTEPPSRRRKNSSVSVQNAMEAFDNSAWGVSIRRSFTLRRPSRDL